MSPCITADVPLGQPAGASFHQRLFSPVLPVRPASLWGQSPKVWARERTAGGSDPGDIGSGRDNGGAELMTVQEVLYAK
jgi:hypothetical protein